jgi:hypothetical protein
LSVTANFLRPQNGAKKETPPGGAGNGDFVNKLAFVDISLIAIHLSNNIILGEKRTPRQLSDIMH